MPVQKQLKELEVLMKDLTVRVISGELKSSVVASALENAAVKFEKELVDSRVWFNHVPKEDGHYLWKLKPDAMEHQVKVKYEIDSAGKRHLSMLCYSLTDFTDIFEKRVGSWKYVRELASEASPSYW